MADQLPPPDPATRSDLPPPVPRVRDSKLVWGVAVAVVLVILATAGFLVLRRDSPKHNLAGTFTLKGQAWDLNSTAGRPCHGKSGYDDIVEGASVVVKNSSGKPVATGHLGPGATISAGESYQMSYCRFPLVITTALPKSDFYTVTVSHRGDVTYSYDDLTAKNWTVDLKV